MMEPAAPGTEDEVNVLPVVPVPSKKKTEDERLLSLKAFLANGKYGKIFELSYSNGAERWYCNVCQCPVMGRAYNHEIGKRHTLNLSNSGRNHHLIEPEPEPTGQILIAPGEPAPPGFEVDVVKVAQIQERLDNYNIGPLVALEYLLELQDFDISKEPSYLCILCDKKGDPRTVLTHLASYNHLSQYLQKHFPTCYRALAPYMTKQYKRNWHSAIQKIAENIEAKYGRLKPFPVEMDKFNKNRLAYLERIAKGKHFYETASNTFEELIDKDELTNVNDDEATIVKEEMAVANKTQTTFIKSQKKRSPSPPVVARPSKKKNPVVFNKRKSLSPVSSVSSDSDLSDVAFESNSRKKPWEKQYNRERSQNYRRSRSPYFKRSGERRSPSPRRGDFRRGNDLKPWQRQNYMRKASPDRYKQKQDEKDKKLEEYNKLAKAIENDMQRIWKQHEKNPEKHPQYNEDWKKFWNKRYKELPMEGKDPTKYDFKPEWILYWNKHMLELHEAELKSKKEALRKRLGIDEPSPVSFKIAPGSKPPTKSSQSQSENKPIPPSACPDNDPEVVIIDDNSRSPDKLNEKLSSDSKNIKQSSSSFNKRIINTGRSNLKGAVDISPGRLSLDGISSSGSSSLDDFDSEKYSTRPRSREEKSYEKIRSRSRSRSTRPRSREEKSYEKIRSRSRSRSKDYRPYKVRSRSRSRDRYLPRPPREEYHGGRERIRTVAELPWNDDPFSQYPEYKPPKIMRDVTRKPMLSDNDDDNEEINVVSVLRLLTALEEKLGSLGPKVIDLLGKALAMEKTEANSSEKLLDNDVTCVLFETIKEKLKGQLLVGLVDYKQEKAFKNAIKRTATLLHLASTRKSEQEKIKPKNDPVKVPGIGTVDKGAIAKQIATALVMQGKTDVTQAELEQLINAVVGMAEAAKNSNKPMTTANFLEQITGGPAPPEIKKPEIVETKKVDVDPQKSNESSLKSEKSNSTTTNMDHLSDSDLQTLLQNFKDLSTDEQHGLINYLKTLEAREPERVERLRKFVNIGSTAKVEEVQVEAPIVEEKPANNNRRSESPFSSRMAGINPASVNEKDVINLVDDIKPKPLEKKTPTSTSANKKIITNLESDEEEDYTFDDVVKAVSKNVEEKELEKKRQVAEDKLIQDKLDTQTIISNLLNTLKSTNASTSQTVKQNDPVTSVPSVSSADFTKTLNSLPVNVANLANIVFTSQQNQQQQQQKQQQQQSNNIEKDSFDIESVNTAIPAVQNNPNTNKFDMFADNFRQNQNPGGGQINYERPPGLDGNDTRNNLSFNRQMRPDFDNLRPSQGFDRPGPGGLERLNFLPGRDGFDHDGPQRDFGGPNMRQGPNNRNNFNFDGPSNNVRLNSQFLGKNQGNNLQNPYAQQNNFQYPSQRGGPFGSNPRFSGNDNNRELFDERRYDNFGGNKPPFNNANQQGGYNNNNRW